MLYQPFWWRSIIVHDSQTGSYKSLTSNWLSCTDITEPVNNKRGLDTKRITVEQDVHGFLESRAEKASVTPLECPLVWARESNAFDCVSKDILLCEMLLR